MKIKGELTIRAKLIASFLAIFVVSLSITIYMSFRVSSGVLIKDTLAGIERDIFYQSQSISTFLGDIKNTVLFLREVPPVQGIIRANENNGFDVLGKSTIEQWDERIKNIFNSFSTYYEGIYMQLRYIDETGQELVRIDYDKKRGATRIVPKTELQNKANRYYFSETMKLPKDSVFISALDLNREEDPPEIEIPYNPVIRYATPVFDEQNGNRKGIIIANVFADNIISNVRNPLYLHSKGNTFLLDKEGYYLEHPEESKKWGSPRDLNTGERLDKDYPELASKIILSESGTIFFGRNAISYAPIFFDESNRNNFVTILRIIPESIFLTPVVSLRNTLLLVSFVIAVLLIILTTLISTSITNPIKKLSEITTKIREGNFELRAEVKSKDELGQLAGDFNIMALHLKQLFGEVKSSAEKIKESEEKYRTIFNGAADAVLISDLDGDFKEANNNAVILTGYSEDELLRMDHLQLYSKEYMARCQEKFREAVQKKYGFEENINILKKNGSIAPADMTISMFEYGGKQFLQFIIRDVSERVALQKHHKEIDHLKSQFINVVSHQLRTPLNSIRWNMEVLLSGDIGKFKKEQEKFLKTIYTSNKNIIDIISDLFLALEIEEGPITLEKEIINFKMLINNIMEGFKNELAIKRIKFNFTIHKNKKPLIVEADRNKLTQILTRLIDNAIKYLKEGGEINIDIEIVKNSAVIKISDSGIGIPKDEQATIFTKFFRASNAALVQQNASGLGLFIAKKIIEAHKGDIWFESTEGKGTTFYISLPMSE